MTMKIGNREISLQNPPLVIAEIGINHGGDLKVAKHMVDLAAGAGCEMIKHQTHFIEDEMTEEAKQIFPPNADVSIWEVMENCVLSADEEIELKRHTEELGLIYISTPFSRKAADFLDDIGVPAFKIGSGEADNLPLIRHIAAMGKPVIMSTGMQSIETLSNSVAILDNAGIDYALLECTNLYPSPAEIVSLRGVTELKQAFPNAVVGFSDHSIGPEMALASVALGPVSLSATIPTAAIARAQISSIRWIRPNCVCWSIGPKKSGSQPTTQNSDLRTKRQSICLPAPVSWRTEIWPRGM